jgi:hypothetical protein
LAKLLQEGGKLVEEEETIYCWLHDIKKNLICIFGQFPSCIQRSLYMMKVQEPLSSLNHVGIATNASIAMTLQ